MVTDLEQRKVDSLSRDYEILMEGWLQEGGYLSKRHRKPLVSRLKQTIERQVLSHYFINPPSWRLRIRGAFGKRTRPDFCITGPAKAGTSDLAVNLLLHPGVMTPLVKEMTMAEFHKCEIYYPTEREKRNWRKRYGTALSPFLTPALHFVEAPHTLAQINPKMKVVIILRDPVARMYSHWKWEALLAGRDRLAAVPFMQTFDGYVDRSLELFPSAPMFTVCGWEGLRTSIYWQVVEYWITCFGRNNVFVLSSEEYFGQRKDIMSQIQAFVGLPQMAPPDVRSKVNENPLQLPLPSDESCARLKRFFRPHNDKLWRIIGKTFDWQ